MEILLRDLNRAISNPEAKSFGFGLRSVHEYQEVISFLSKCYPGSNWDEFNLSFLHKPVKDLESQAPKILLSEKELLKWKHSVSQIRGYLEHVLEDQK